MKYWVNIFKDKRFGFHSCTYVSQEDAIAGVCENIETEDDYFHTIIYNSKGVSPIRIENFYDEAKSLVEEEPTVKDPSSDFDYKGL